jgi:hypothetical protein
MPRDRFHFYEIAVTNADMLARFCRALHPATPTTLREDFSGTAALARAWLSLAPDHRAIAVDHDAAVLARAKRDARTNATRLRTLSKDVLQASTNTAKADIIAATNFPLGYFHTRDDLLTYLKATRRRLNRKGLFLADLYGGASAFDSSTTRRTFREPDRRRFTYLWEQREANAVTGLVHNAIHFQFKDNAGRTKIIRDAFTYHWRLWSIPELTDALRDAGFSDIECHQRLGDAIDAEGNLYVSKPDPDELLDRDWVVYVVARA